MSALLGSEVFDDFLLSEATIKTYNTFHIDGKIVPEFYDDYEFGDEFSRWKDMRQICFDLIKGKTLPVSFLFVMQLDGKLVKELLTGNFAYPDYVKGFNLNIRYQNGVITLITATVLNTFTPDKTPDEIWDSYMSDFLKLRYDFVD